MFTSSRLRELFPLVVVLLSLSCNDPYEQTTTKATYSFRLAANTISESHFTFNEGYLSLQRFSLMTRSNLHKLEESDHKVDEETNPFRLHSATGEQNITKKAESGVYQSMAIELLFPETVSNVPFVINTDGSVTWSEVTPVLYPILIEGNFHDGEITRSIILAIDSPRVLKFEAQRETLSSNPDKTVILDKENFITLTLSPQRWFSEITSEMITSAQTVRRNNDDVVFIHRTFNADLYQIIINRLTLPGQLRVRTNPS